MPLSATRIVREMLFVPPSMPALDLLAKMQATPHPSRPGGRRIRRHRRPGFDGGHRRGDRRRDRRRARRGRQALGAAPARRLVRRRRARQPRRRGRGDRPRIRRRRSGQGGRHAGRLPDGAGRPAAAARRAGERPAGIRDRGAGLRSAADQARAHPPPQRPQIEHDREGRRRYSGPDVSSPTIAAAAPAEPAASWPAKIKLSPRRRRKPRKLHPARDDRRRKPPRHADHAPRAPGGAGLGLAARADRVRGGRGLGAGAVADRSLAGAVLHLPGAGLAGRRRRRRPARRRAERVRRRLVVRLRLFLRRALLDRPRLPGRRQDVRLAAAVRGDRGARRAGAVHRRSASRWRARSGRAARCASCRSRSRSPSPNGCAATCSPAFPGTPTAMRSPARWCWRRPRR